MIVFSVLSGGLEVSTILFLMSPLSFSRGDLEALSWRTILTEGYRAVRRERDVIMVKTLMAGTSMFHPISLQVDVSVSRWVTEPAFVFVSPSNSIFPPSIFMVSVGSNSSVMGFPPAEASRLIRGFIS